MSDSLRPVRAPPAATLAAAEWLSRREGGEDLAASPAFAAWLDAAPEHRAAWTQAETVWSLVDAEARHDPLLQAMRRDALAARPPPPPAPRWRLGAAIVAGLAAAVVLAVVTLQWRGALVQKPSSQQVASSAQAGRTYDNGAGLPTTVALDDGSSVTLDAGSTIQVVGRRVTLTRGQAYFQVIHDPARPFQVAARDVVLTDIGTNFNVAIAGQRTVTTVICGRVSAAAPRHPGTRPVVLSANQRLEASAGAFTVRSVDAQAVLAWRQAMLTFHDTPLSQAVAEVNRYGGPPARVEGLEDLKVSGAFRAGDPTRFARTLAEIYPIKVRERADGGVDITRR
ncbi:FecR family protein [Caulobacter sp. KR2-114]|uniref:FecR family protein n=1 Tax=Caulobacter sp. KR2-114 TaxID=3400912 RepID=UPI003C0E5E8D